MSGIAKLRGAVRSLALGTLGAILYYAPTIVLLRYVTWEGEPSDERWVAGFKWCSLLALAHCAAFLAHSKPFDRFALGADLWLVVCGVLVWLQAWPPLELFGGQLRESGFWIVVLAVSVGATFATPGGLIGAGAARTERARRYSLFLLAMIALAAVASYGLRGSTLLAVVLPVALLSALRTRLATLIERQDKAG